MSADTEQVRLQEQRGPRLHLESMKRTPKTFWRRYRFWILTPLNLAAFFLAWEYIGRVELINPLFLPRASDMFVTFWRGLTGTGTEFVDGVLRENLAYSLRNLFAGVVIAIVAAVPIGLFMGANRWLDMFLSPYIWSLHALPNIAIVPLMILFLGFEARMHITIIAIGASFPILINSWAGVKTTDKSMLAAAKVFGAKRRQLYTKVVFPYTLPFIMTGLQHGMASGFVGMLVAEFLGGSQGLGFLIIRASDTFNSALLYAVLFTVVVLALTLIQSSRWIEAKVAPWRSLRGL